MTIEEKLQLATLGITFLIADKYLPLRGVRSGFGRSSKGFMASRKEHLVFDGSSWRIIR